MGAVQTARHQGLNIIPIKIDEKGMKADGKGGSRRPS